MRFRLVAVELDDLKTVFLERIPQLRIPNRIYMQRHFDPFAELFSHLRYRLAREWFEMRSVAIDEPLQTFFNVQNIWNACDQVPAGPQQFACAAQEEGSVPGQELAARAMQVFALRSRTLAP